MIYQWFQIDSCLYYLLMTPICFARERNWIFLLTISILNWWKYTHGWEQTNYMLFTPKCFPRTMEHIVIDGHKIEEASQTKFLGVILNNKLNWAAHCNYICCKMSKGIGIIIKARMVFNETTLLSLYNSLILPYISYCIHVWGKAYDTHLKNVLVLQKKVLHVIVVYHHIHILTTCLFNLISFQSKSSMSILLVLLCINMIMECFLNYLVICSLL